MFLFCGETCIPRPVEVLGVGERAEEGGDWGGGKRSRREQKNHTCLVPIIPTISSTNLYNLGSKAVVLWCRELVEGGVQDGRPVHCRGISLSKIQPQLWVEEVRGTL